MEPQAPAADPLAQYQHALGLHHAGRLDEAAALYRAMLAQFPGNPLLMTGIGIIALQQGRVDEGVEQLAASLRIEPAQPMALSNLGMALRSLKRLEEALACLDQAVSLAPDFAEAFNHRGIVLHDLRRLDEALDSFDRAVALEPDSAAAWMGRGIVLRQLRRWDEALDSQSKAIMRAPQSVEPCLNRGNVLMDMNALEEAVADYDRAIALQPGNAAAHASRGVALTRLKRLDEALASLNRAVTLRPDYAEACNSRGIVLYQMHRFAEALADYDRALAADPDYAPTYWSKGFLKLQLGELEEGWRLAEWRWKDWARDYVRPFAQPLWLGNAPIDGKTVLVYPEQGLGDFIQFCRYIPMVAARGAKVVVESPAALVSLLSTLKADFTLVRAGEPLPHFDVQCPIMSLPLAFRTTMDTIPADVPYLYADPARREVWRQRLGPRTRLRVGLAWSGNPSMRDDANRSIPFRALAPLLALPVDFHVLQKDIRPEDAAALARCPNVQVHTAQLNDFADTAALAAEMDLVISVCTSIAHLAGALGRPLWVLLSHTADWRWFLDRSDSPWYPSATLFRQEPRGDWASLVAEIMPRLRALAGETNCDVSN